MQKHLPALYCQTNKSLNNKYVNKFNFHKNTFLLANTSRKLPGYASRDSAAPPTTMPTALPFCRPSPFSTYSMDFESLAIDPKRKIRKT